MGQKYAAYNLQGQIIGFYDSEDSPLPSGVTAIEITDAQWQSCLSTSGYTVQNGALVAPAPPTADELLAQARAAQIATLYASYRQAIAQPVSYTSKGGVTKTYQADPQSLANLQNMLLAFQAAGATPSGFYWVAADNTQVPFTYADMQGLAQALGEQGVAAFAKFQTFKSAVKSATSIDQVQQITWK